ncbi:hypothetical protein [Ureibacillus thermophilus]|uniref:hypothetical protein n=1 Tax=Ureibacillus thermophilus TaxID=367743 RepID=UPI001ABFEBA5|nr:hypothetical protein [Ureibacillus thermophilus]
MENTDHSFKLNAHHEHYLSFNKEVESLPNPRIPLKEPQRIVANYREKSAEIKEKMARLKKSWIRQN